MPKRPITTLLLSLLVLAWPCVAIAQAPKPVLRVLKASEMSWSGGIAGRRGTKYFFELTGSRADYQLDSIWLPGHVLRAQLNAKRSGSRADTLAVFAELDRSESYGALQPHLPNEQPKLKPRNPTPPVPISGAALISYRCGGQTQYLQVPRLEVLPPQNYP